MLLEQLCSCAGTADARMPVLRYRSSPRDGSYLSNVAADHVTDECLHVVVDAATLRHSCHNGAKVVVSQHHVTCFLCYLCATYMSTTTM